MADFMTDLWNAVFEAGPTPTLLLATNATFAALQILLFALLLATYSIHFVILSLLCGGLWYAINWFAAEIRAAQQQQEDAADKVPGQQEQDGTAKEQDDDSAYTVSATEAAEDSQGATRNAPPVSVHVAGTGKTISQLARSTAKPVSTASDAGDHQASEHSIRQRSTHVDTCGEPSTDSDWEKIDEER
ncbi:hypothetical protein AMS68_005983 [Peltaster fructicola]|uniref:Uncharacterized protein n=1 Tax=Peltaster fructicola TaxID=286661 RepID=A0A6H0Y0K7_9PEZI|nr:hypothetical protein AMS68_005983 [Peltaster fructicola]